jgi:serine phosphatase RsbU (regulator of sigma subunit)
LLQVGRHVLRHDFQPPAEAAAAMDMERDIDKARLYVLSLLPAPLRSADMQVDWVLKPSSRLGGDALGYFDLDAQHFVCYLIDVSGHGTGAALHVVAVLNMLRQRSLPDTNFADPAQVLQKLNAAFQMQHHGGMFFTIWYGVYDRAERQLRYASAGHPPTYLRRPGALTLEALATRGPVIGALQTAQFVAQQVAITPGSRLYAFSDGVFEGPGRDGQQRGLADFLPLLQNSAIDAPDQPQRLLDQVIERSRPGPLDDDFTLLTLTFLA